MICRICTGKILGLPCWTWFYFCFIDLICLTWPWKILRIPYWIWIDFKICWTWSWIDFIKHWAQISKWAKQEGRYKSMMTFFSYCFLTPNIALIHAVLIAPSFGNLCMMISPSTLRCFCMQFWVLHVTVTNTNNTI